MIQNSTPNNKWLLYYFIPHRLTAPQVEVKKLFKNTEFAPFNITKPKPKKIPEPYIIPL